MPTSEIRRTKQTTFTNPKSNRGFSFILQTDKKMGKLLIVKVLRVSSFLLYLGFGCTVFGKGMYKDSLLR